MRRAGNLRRELSARNQQIALTTGSVHELTVGETPSVIFGCNESQQHGNFYPASYRNICANPEWARRLGKVHSASRRAGSQAAWRWPELDCANSSDALLMNIFCCRGHTQKPCREFHAGCPFGSSAAVWVQARNSTPQREDGPYGGRHETRRPHGGSQAYRDRFSNSIQEND